KHKTREDKAFVEEPEKPIQGRLYASDVTVPALAPILLENPKGLLVYRDELSAWLNSFDEYKSRSGSDLPNWLSMFRAEPITLDRKTGEPWHIRVPLAAVSITGGIQPSILAQTLKADYFEAGLAARLLFAYPPKRRKTWTDLIIEP